jgi:hypothetical protein
VVAPPPRLTSFHSLRVGNHFRPGLPPITTEDLNRNAGLLEESPEAIKAAVAGFDLVFAVYPDAGGMTARTVKGANVVRGLMLDLGAPVGRVERPMPRRSVRRRSPARVQGGGWPQLAGVRIDH